MNRPFLIPVQYGRRRYPKDITPSLQEIAGHFDIESIHPSMDYSLHTEYSYAPRQLCSEPVVRFPSIISAHRNMIPKLWFNEDWAKEFADFILALANQAAPKVIEIHPPFKDYCPDISCFIERFLVFENKIRSEWPKVQILIENRSGSMYHGSRFLTSEQSDLIALLTIIQTNNISLGLALDIPQLLTAHGGPEKLDASQINMLLSSLRPHRHLIKGIHLWGKKRNEKGRAIAHAGDLNTYFDDRTDLKNSFLDSLATLFDDDIRRYFVPEVNSTDEHLCSIVQDLADHGFLFKK